MGHAGSELRSRMRDRLTKTWPALVFQEQIWSGQMYGLPKLSVHMSLVHTYGDSQTKVPGGIGSR